MIYAKAFFDLQLMFAHRIAVLSGRPLGPALLEYTNFYIRFGLGRDFDPAEPAWQEYLGGLQSTSDPGEWTYRFYLARRDVMAGPEVVASFGCFAYARSGADRIRLHFQNAEREGHSPLGGDRLERRFAELTALFEHVKRTERHPVRVVGTSWLYNLGAYRRLFPAPYLASARAITGRFQHMPLWGQFVDRRGAVREDMVRPFVHSLARQSSVENLDQCFPFQVLRVEAPVTAFYARYGIEPPAEGGVRGSLVEAQRRGDDAEEGPAAGVR